MKYLATIKYGSESHSELFATEAQARQWLDERNNNLECDTIIDIFEDNWKLVDGYFYTRKADAY